MYNQQQPPITPLVPPHHQETFTSAVTVPIVQSLVTGALVGLALGVLAWAFEINIEFAPPWKIGLVSCVVIIALVWLINLKAWARRLENLLGVDLNGDGYVGEQSEPETLRVVVDSDNGRLTDILGLVGGREKLRIMATALLNGDIFAERKWAGNGKVFTGTEYKENLTQLVNRGMLKTAVEGSNKHGYKLTQKGGALMRELAGVTRKPDQNTKPAFPPSPVHANAFDVGYVANEYTPTHDFGTGWSSDRRD